MKVYVPGKTLILSNFTGKNSDRIFPHGICIDIINKKLSCSLADLKKMEKKVCIKAKI